MERRQQTTRKADTGAGPKRQYQPQHAQSTKAMTTSIVPALCTHTTNHTKTLTTEIPLAP